MQYFLDSNIFLRFFTDEKDAEILKECTTLISNIKNGKFKATTSHIVLAEVVWTLTSYYKASKPDIVKVLKVVDSLSGLKISNAFTGVLATGLFEKNSVKYIDALIASNPWVQSGKITIISYDKDFDKLGVKRLEPKQINTF